MRSAATGSLRLRRRRRARRAPRRVRGAARGRFRRRMARRAARAARRPLPGSALPSGRRGPAARTARSAARGPRRRGGCRDPRARPRRGSGRTRGRDDRRRDRRVSERSPGRARRADHPDPRPDDRDRAATGASVPDAALRPARLRLLAPGRGGTDPCRRLPRLRPRVRVHDLGGDDAADPGCARRLRRAAPRPQTRESRIAGPASLDWSPT